MEFHRQSSSQAGEKYQVTDVGRLVSFIFRIGFSIAIAYVAYVYYLAPVTFLDLTHYMASWNEAFIDWQDWTVFGLFVLSIIVGVRNLFRFASELEWCCCRFQSRHSWLSWRRSSQKQVFRPLQAAIYFPDLLSISYEV
jgi:hypothetical protein